MTDSNNDIEKYLNGELSPSEMHTLERKALSDPFLAEALEGAGSIPKSHFQDDLDKIHTSLNQRIKRRDNRTIAWNWPLRIAAGLLLLAASTYIIITLTDNSSKTNEQLALNKIQAEEASPVPADGPSVMDSAALETNIADNRQPSLQDQKAESKIPSPVNENQRETTGVSAESESSSSIALDTQNEISVTEDAPKIPEIPVQMEGGEKIAKRDVASQEIPASSSSAEGTRDEKRTTSKRAAPVSRSTSSEERSQQSSAHTVARKLISGRVIDSEDGTPIPGVDILIKGTTTGTATDIHGNYEIALPADSSSLVFSFVGLESKEVKVDDNRSNVDVSLSPDLSQLSEVVVIGYSSDAKEAKETSWELAEPEGGRKEYKKYLEKNMTYPEQAIKNKVEGRVTAQFTVEPNGQLSDFRVVKSLGYGCDEEVLRLIKQGPTWAPSKRNAEPIKGRVKVRMRFLLPGSDSEKKK